MGISPKPWKIETDWEETTSGKIATWMWKIIDRNGKQVVNLEQGDTNVDDAQLLVAAPALLDACLFPNNGRLTTGESETDGPGLLLVAASMISAMSDRNRKVITMLRGKARKEREAIELATAVASSAVLRVVTKKLLHALKEASQETETDFSRIIVEAEMALSSAAGDSE